MPDIFLYISIACSSFFFLIQIFYGFVFLKTATYSFSEENTSEITPTTEGISVIVAARNEFENLQKLIPALLAQDYSNFEIIIIDDRSYDETRQIIFDAQQLHKQIKLVRIDERPSKPDEPDAKKFALTMGIKAAKNDRLLFIDADCLPSSTHWISSMAAKFTKDKSFVLGISLYEKKDSLLNSFIQFETLMTVTQYISWAILGSPYMGVGRNLAYRKSIFMENNGYHKHLRVTGGDDDLIVNRLATEENTTVCIATDSITNSSPKETWNDWYRQKKRHLSVGKHYKFSDKLRTAMFSISIILFWYSLIAQGIITWFTAINSPVDISWSYYIMGTLVLVRWLFLTITLHQIAQKLTIQASAWTYPFWEICYVAYQWIVGFAAITSKNITWK